MYLQFVTYQQIIRERQGKGFSENEVKEIVRQVLEKLVQWHDQGQAYGFISLETIAYDSTTNQILLLQGNQFVNGYVAPEVAQSGQISKSGDIYALGVAIACLLTAQEPETLRDIYGNWNWSDRCVVSDQLEQAINIALADYAPHRYIDARQMLQTIFPDLQVAYSAPSDQPITFVATQPTYSQKNRTLGLAIGIGIVFCGAAGIGVSRLLTSENNVATNDAAKTPVIQTTVTITPEGIATPSPSPSLLPSPTTPPSPANPFESNSFPQPVCGDPLPANNSSSVSLYPVFVEYSDANLQQMRSRFCQDAIAKTRKGSNRQAVQVASFTSRDRAVLFASFLSKYFQGAEVGEPTVLENSARSSARSEDAIVVSRDRVSFPSGSTSTRISGNISNTEKRQYILNCGSGQSFSASLLQGQANIRLIAPDGATVGSSVNKLNVVLPSTGDYTLEISASTATNFNLQIEVL